MLRDSVALNSLLLAAVVLCALSVVTSQHKARKLFNELQKEKEQAEQMEVEWGQLQLEQSTLATSSRIEQIAAKQLQMHLPKSGQIRVIRIEQLSLQPIPPGGESGARGAQPSNRPFTLSGKGEQSFEGASQQP